MLLLRLVAAILLLVIVQAQDCPQTSYYFPRENQITDYIEVKQSIPDLTEFTVCGWFDYEETATDLEPHWYSYINTEVENRPAFTTYTKYNMYDDNLMMVEWDKNGGSIGGSFPKSESYFYFCVVSNVTSGFLTYRDGKKSSGDNRVTDLIKGEGSLIIGQGNYNGALRSTYAYKGNIRNFMMWNRELSSDEISEMYFYKCSCAPGYIVALTEDNIELHGAVSSIAQEQCPSTSSVPPEVVTDCPQTSYHFPRTGQITDFIEIKKNVPDLTEFSICGWYSYEDTAGGSPRWFSYANTDYTSAFSTYYSFSGTLFVGFGTSGTGKKMSPSATDFHFCLITNSIYAYQAYANGEIWLDYPMSMGQIKGDGTLLVGQGLANYYGSLPSSYAYKGNITNFMMWDRLLTATEVADMYASKCYCAPGYMFALTEENIEVYGAVTPIAQEECPTVPPTSSTPSTSVPPLVVTDCPQTSYKLPYDDQITDYIRAKQPFRNLNEFSFCGWFTYYPTEDWMVSYATVESDNAYAVYHTATKICVYINGVVGDCVSFQAPASGSDFHMCISTLVSTTGESNVYVDGNMAMTVSGTPSQIDHEGILILGQDQDKLGGGFQATSAYKGLISNFMMWDRILDATEIQSMYLNKCSCASGFKALTLEKVELFGAAFAVAAEECS